MATQEMLVGLSTSLTVFVRKYKDFKEQATVINKENEANKYAEQLAQEITFKRAVGEYDDVTYTAIFENTSDIEFVCLIVEPLT